MPDLSTTRPIALHVPDPPHDLAWPSSRSLNPTNWSFSYLFGLGKGYLNLYKTGFKNVYYNWKTTRQIQERIGSKKIEDVLRGARYRKSPRVTYNELELALRTKKDLSKLVPFGLIFAVCGEFTPLVILAFGSSVVPGTCVVPKQQAQELKKTLQRYDTWAQEMAALLHQSKSNFNPLLRKQREEQQLSTELKAKQPEFFPSTLLSHSDDQLRRIGSLEAFRLGLLPLKAALNPKAPLSYPWLWLANRRYKQTYSHVYSAAIAVQREGGWSTKSPLDMWEWGMKYGLYQLIQYARDAHGKGENPVSDEMKKKLLRAFERETQHLVTSGASEMRLSGDRQHILDFDSPDAIVQRAEIEATARNKMAAG